MTRGGVIPVLLAIYAAVVRLATPLLRRYLARRLERGREDAARLGERWGEASMPRPPGALLWLHAASVGEFLSALPVIEAVRRDHSGLALLVTTSTVTSARLAGEKLPQGAIHQFVPIDHPGAVGRFLGHWRPQAAIFVESEFWPLLLSAARRHGVELILLNGRVSPSSYRGWRRLRPLARHLLSLFSLLLAQTEVDRRRLVDLGAPAARCVGNLKRAARPLAADGVELQRLVAMLGPRLRWLAASTHPGEEEIVAEAHLRLADRHRNLLTLLVPRHPERGPEIKRLLARRGLKVARRGAGEAVTAETQIYLADSLGELGLWYRLSEIAFVGKSLVPHGGQNLLEPAKLSCALLAGPHTDNFPDIAETFEQAGALLRVRDAGTLATAVGALLDDDKRRRTMIEAAARCAEAEAGVLQAILAALDPALRAAEAGRCGPTPGADRDPV